YVAEFIARIVLLIKATSVIKDHRISYARAWERVARHRLHTCHRDRVDNSEHDIVPVTAHIADLEPMAARAERAAFRQAIEGIHDGVAAVVVDNRERLADSRCKANADVQRRVAKIDLARDIDLIVLRANRRAVQL